MGGRTVTPRGRRPQRCTAARAMRPSSVIAPPLSRYSFQLPHFGDCTHDGQPSSHGHAATRSRVARTCRSRPRTPARRCRRRRGSRRRRRSSARRSAGASAIDTPPTSQRSQIVNSGSIPISPCSAACSVPSSWPGAIPARSTTSAGTVYQHARVDERALGQVEVAHLDHAVRRDLLALVPDDLVATSTRTEVHLAAADRRELVVGDDRDVGLGARLGVLVGVVVRLDQRDVIARSSSSTRYCWPWWR